MKAHAPRIALSLLFLLPGLLLSAEAKPGLGFSPPAWDAGALLRGTRARLAVTVTNGSTAEAAVSFMPTCTCLSVEPASRLIAPGASARFTLGYDTKDVAGAGRTVVPDRKAFIVRSGLPGDPAPYYYFVTAAVHSAVSDATLGRPWIAGTGRDVVVSLSYWYDAGCRECNDFIGSWIPLREQELGLRIEMLLKDPGVPLLEEELSRLLPQRAKQIPTYPVLRAGYAMIQGDSEIREKLAGILKAAVGAR
jgi:hypothetical protein